MTVINAAQETVTQALAFASVNPMSLATVVINARQVIGTLANALDAHHATAEVHLRSRNAICTRDNAFADQV